MRKIAAYFTQRTTPSGRWFYARVEVGSLELCRVSPPTATNPRNCLFLSKGAEIAATTRAGDLLTDTETRSWQILFTMQHFGLPTRLLDWSRSFAVALYFAVRDATGDCAVWILNPYALNQREIDQYLIEPDEISVNYSDFLLGQYDATALGNVFALVARTQHRRILSQRAAFTLHIEVDKPLEVLHPDFVKKLVIPSAVLPAARDFLLAAGVSEFALFPDLEGLARDVWQQILLS